jgi:hypothetical protein
MRIGIHKQVGQRVHVFADFLNRLRSRSDGKLQITIRHSLNTDLIHGFLRLMG